MAYPQGLEDAIAAIVAAVPVIDQVALETELRLQIDVYGTSEWVSGSNAKASLIESKVRRVLSQRGASPERIINAILTST